MLQTAFRRGLKIAPLNEDSYWMLHGWSGFRRAALDGVQPSAGKPPDDPRLTANVKMQSVSFYRSSLERQIAHASFFPSSI